MRTKSTKSSFTLIEVMIGLSIVGIIISIIGMNTGHLFSGTDDWEGDDITCSWWVEHDLCLCQVGIFDTRWGFVAPHRVCEQRDDIGIMDTRNEDR